MRGICHFGTAWNRLDWRGVVVIKRTGVPGLFRSPSQICRAWGMYVWYVWEYSSRMKSHPIRPGATSNSGCDTVVGMYGVQIIVDVCLRSDAWEDPAIDNSKQEPRASTGQPGVTK